MDTYIIECLNGEFYCGKSNHLQRRLKEHREEKRPHWFGFKNRKQFKLVWHIPMDVEKNIKRFGVKKFMECLRF